MLLLFHTAFTPLFGTAPRLLRSLFKPEISPTIRVIPANHGYGRYSNDRKKMEPIATWEKLLLGVLVLLVILWFSPGIKKMMKVSREAKSDWIGLIIPIAMISLFVFVLIQII